MKVKELIAALSKLSPELEVLCYSEDEALLAEGHGFRLLEINHVEESEGEKMRDDGGIPTLKLGKSPHSTKIAFMDVTAAF
jgi:hypothetical protein